MARQNEVLDLAVGRALRSIRDARGEDGRQVAEAIGWDRQKVYRLERGDMLVRYAEVKELAAYYGYTMAEIDEMAENYIPMIEKIRERQEAMGHNRWSVQMAFDQDEDGLTPVAEWDSPITKARAG